MREGGGGVFPATAVHSHSTSPPSGAGQIHGSGLSGEQPSLPGNSLGGQRGEVK